MGEQNGFTWKSRGENLEGATLHKGDQFIGLVLKFHEDFRAEEGCPWCAADRDENDKTRHTYHATEEEAKEALLKRVKGE